MEKMNSSMQGWNCNYIFFLLDMFFFFPLIYHSIQVTLPLVSGIATQGIYQMQH